jgi:hypothetical protein
MTGRGRPTEVLIDSVFAPIPGATQRTTFSEVYPELQRRAIDAQRIVSDQTKAIARRLELEAKPDSDLSPTGFERAWQESVHQLGAAERAEIDSKLMAAVFGSPFNVEFENELAIVSGFDDKSPMRNVIAPADFVEKLQQLTRERGAKSRLARNVLKVSRQRLNEWLSGRSKPSARYLLLLLNWMRHQQMPAVRARLKKPNEKLTKSGEFSKPAEEAKPKQSAGSASTRPAQKTRAVRKSKHEKPKNSDQKKK